MSNPFASLAAAAGLACAVSVAAAPAVAAPQVVASIKPIHSLVAAVMEGVGTPALIVKGAASPHTYAMKPSDAKALASADVVVWVGPEFEGFLAKPLASAGKATVVALMDAPGMTLLDAREGGAWEPHDHGHEHGHGDKHEHDHKAGHDDHGHDAVNSHIWLSPANAKRIVAVTAEALSAKDPANAGTYAANAARTAAALDALDGELKTALAPVAGRPFVVFHDAYQYFEAAYGLSGVGAITVNPDRRPSAKRLAAIRDTIKGLGAVCVFAEPQFEPTLVNTVVEGTRARTGTLDAEAADIPEGPALYPTLMRRLASSLAGCLKG
ncbi:zinc transport system substrate-binding protein [Azospirillum fermentarium]|uniref:zinc ABC transporter substrate-binding protein ZnuA n=1 Tax=Azospirillum fermentarium TaxID=1233114 RepID=UPI002227636D|nr:zinc ABC transporter substrate-binding protein ZnuA [Azospirillum fermentarium]MCW2245654.1 zinc transport system substrate-binding protein [Azospirillum fermentarium]